MSCWRSCGRWMRSARRNIGERLENLSSLPATGRPDDRWRMETGGRGSTKSVGSASGLIRCPSGSVQTRTHLRVRRFPRRSKKILAHELQVFAQYVELFCVRPRYLERNHRFLDLCQPLDECRALFGCESLERLTLERHELPVAAVDAALNAPVIHGGHIAQCGNDQQEYW